MAGYMTKLMGYVYDGAHIAAENLQNGVLAVIAADGVKVATTGDAAFRVAPEGKTTLWGMPALTLDVTKACDELFLVENEWEINDNEEYDTSKYELKAGKLVRMHRLVAGDQFIMTVAEEVYNAANEGDAMAVAAGGTVAKA